VWKINDSSEHGIRLYEMLKIWPWLLFVDLHMLLPLADMKYYKDRLEPVAEIKNLESQKTKKIAPRIKPIKNLIF